ncbi:CHAT domain-containing protein [Xylaria cf. heliscus]|nr:CHAT domain-containing protein [Xylaria cf. heliscus]
MENLEADIEAGWATVEAATRVDHPRKGGLLAMLGLLLSERYSRTGDIYDIERAIQVTREACDSTPKFHKYQPMRLGSLADVLCQNYFARRRMADLNQAIRIRRVSAHTLPVEHPDRLKFLVSLAAGLGLKYSRTKKSECIEEAIGIGRKIAYDEEVFEFNPKAAYTMPLSVTTLYTLRPDDRMWYLNRLCMLLQERYARIGSEADIEEAIRVGKKGLELGQHDYLEEAEHLRVFADALYENYKISGAVADLDEAIKYFEAAMHRPISHIFDRVLAGRRLLQCYAVILDWDQAYKTAAAVMKLIPTLSGRLVDENAMQDVLAEMVGLSSDMAAIALNAGQGPFAALNFIEHGRNLVTAHLDETRLDISDLQQRNPDLAAELTQCRAVLDRYMAGPNIFNDPAFHRLFWRGRETFQYDAKIRTAATRGPVVVVNISEYRCDAILIETNQIRSLPLPNLTSREVRRRAQVSRPGSLSVMCWLWDSLARPVLDALGYTRAPDNDVWPHVWWVTSGAMSRFPIHAAGRLFAGSADTVLDRVISSYSTCIKTIIATRCHHVQPDEEQEEVLLVSIDDTVGRSKLPFAREEVNIVGALCREMGLRSRTSRNTTLFDIIRYLGQSRIMHFAGHGYTDAAEPRRSHLVLAGDNTFPTSESPGRLSVDKLLAMNLHNLPLFLACLSACGTSRVRNDAPADQTTIHLVGACQLAGFRHVVGTLWEVVDRRCVDVVRIAYEAIRDGGMSDESVCWGLHQAIRELRDQWMRSVAKARRPTRMAERGDALFLDGEANDASGVGITGVGCVEEPPRDIVPCDSDGEEDIPSPYWVPYVHYGV